jgi:glycopeptide antibiotics resistance protein
MWWYLFRYYFNPSVLVAGTLVFLVVLVMLRRRGFNWPYLIFLWLFWLYSIVLVSMVVFSGIHFRPVTWEDRLAMIPAVLARVNLIPFSFGGGVPSYYANASTLLNLVMTIPLGFGLNFLITTRIKRMALIALLVGLGFELGQLVLTLYAASPTRGIDITDVLLNGAGVLLGYGLFHLFAWLYVTIIGRWHLKPKGLFAFLYEVSLHARRAG